MECCRLTIKAFSKYCALRCVFKSRCYLLKASLVFVLAAIFSLSKLVSGIWCYVLMSLPENTAGCKHEEEEEEEDSERELFIEVLEELQINQVGDFVLSIRKASDQSQRGDAVTTKGCNDCTVIVADPLFGSYNVAIPIIYSDGVKWILKISAEGTKKRFDVSSQQALLSEARTMQFLKKRTTIPIPAVLAYDASLSNTLHCPFILMEFIEGMTAYDCWFNRKISKDCLQAHRMQCLKDIAFAMVQLSPFTFDHGGLLLFDKELNPVGVGPFGYVDNLAMLERAFRDDDHDDDDGNGTDARGGLGLGEHEEKQKKHLQNREQGEELKQKEQQKQKHDQKGDDLFAIYVEAGPITDVKTFYTFMLDRQNKANDDFEIGYLKLLRYFIDWLPEPNDESAKSKPFVLTHPDLNFQNVIVSEDGCLQGLIDWDGAISIPRSVGNESYPSWLTRDWDPAKYGYTSEMEKGIEPVGIWENSPETLAFYRSVYQDYIRSAYCQKQFDATKEEQDMVEIAPTSLARSKITRRSLIAENLYYAATDPVCTTEVLINIFDELAERMKTSCQLSDDQISTIEASRKSVHSPSLDEIIPGTASEDDTATNTAKAGWEDFNFFDVCEDLRAGQLDEKRWRYLREGFELLLDSV